MHAEVQIDGTPLMLSDEMPAFGTKSAATLGGSPMVIHHYTQDVDAVFTRATGAKGKALMPVADMFWGGRYGSVLDPAGIPWGVATHKEDLTPAQMQERMNTTVAKDPPAS